MEKKNFHNIEALLELPQQISFSEFENFIGLYVNRKMDKDLAIRELDNMLSLAHNHVLSLSLQLKQNHVLKTLKTTLLPEDELYTKQEVAVKFRVSVRTVTNWIIDGLEAIDIGGVKRISRSALEKFKKSAKGKKFTWKSVSNRY